MKGWVSGLAIGLVLGGTGTSLAQSLVWFTVKDILGFPFGRNDQMLYAEGANDALTTIVSNPDASLSFWRARNNCMRTHLPAGELQRWAVGVWQTNVDSGRGDRNAASILIADACK
jgi:hypothetical protein